MKKRIILLVSIIIVVSVCFVAVQLFNNYGNLSEIAEMKKYYIDFAMDYRIDFIPDFDENSYDKNSPVSTTDFLMLTYYMNKENLPQDFSMSTELVEKVMAENFGIFNVKHESQFKGWTYVEDENKYFPLPEGTAEEILFDLINSDTYNIDDREIYDVTLMTYGFPCIIYSDDEPSIDDYNYLSEYAKDKSNFYAENVEFLLSEKGEELRNEEINVYNAIYDLILEDNTDGFTVGTTIQIKYYIDDQTGKPMFIYKREALL